MSVHYRQQIDSAGIHFLHLFHFTFEVSDFCSTTQPAFPSWIPHCESGTSIFPLVWHSVFRLFLTVHHWLRSQLLPVCHSEEMASLHEHQEHHPEGLRWQIQGHFPGYLWEVRKSIGFISVFGTLVIYTLPPCVFFERVLLCNYEISALRCCHSADMWNCIFLLK